MMTCAAPRLSPAARQRYINILSIQSRAFSISRRRSDSSHFNRPFTGSYDPDEPTGGPLSTASNHGVPRLTPRKLKDYLDKFVVGQERPKMMMSVAIYNHYQRTYEMYRQEQERQEKEARLLRKNYERIHRHPSEDEYPGQVPTVDMSEGKAVDLHDPQTYDPRRLAEALDKSDETEPTIIEKSNVLLIGPTGAGKTHIVKTLAKVLNVPFSISDCTPLTQSGYIGEDAEVVVHRLLAAADFDVAAAEHGIIYLDEVDKLAASRDAAGKDVSGEGVQQALLKILEGTTVNVTAKSDKRAAGGFGGAAGAGSLIGGSSKQETYQVRTDNILFICSGAFVGLDKIILKRVSRASIGFGAIVHNKAADSPALLTNNPHSLDTALFKTLPFSHHSTQHDSSAEKAETPFYNILDLAQPRDLQAFGMIPEFIGRIPITTALTPLSTEQLMRILTEPRNSICSQYIALFATSGVELKFTTAALHALATAAREQGTGARGLRTVVERALGDAMYEVPGTSVKYVLVTEAGVKGEAKLGFWGRGMVSGYKDAFEREEAEWEKKHSKSRTPAEEVESESFVEYRKLSAAVGG